MKLTDFFAKAISLLLVFILMLAPSQNSGVFALFFSGIPQEYDLVAVLAEKDLYEKQTDQASLVRGKWAPRPDSLTSEARYWGGFHGEYWEDELGYYEVTLVPACMTEDEKDAGGGKK